MPKTRACTSNCCWRSLNHLQTLEFCTLIILCHFSAPSLTHDVVGCTNPPPLCLYTTDKDPPTSCLMLHSSLILKETDGVWFWERTQQKYLMISFHFRRNWHSVCKTKSVQTVLLNWMWRWVFLVFTSERLAPSPHGLNYWPTDWVMIRGRGSRGLLGSRVQTADI